MERGRGGGGMVGLLFVQALSEYYRRDRKPPVTAALIAANTIIYLRPKFLHPILPTLNRVWFNPHLILKHKDIKRFLLSAFYHIGESHLFYNMLSLLWKGIQMETAMGSFKFASMVAALLGMSQGITLLLAKSLLILFDYQRAYYNEYSVGFSGVLFAMKVVLYNSHSDDVVNHNNNYTFVHGLVVPTRYAAWAELILVQMFVPGVSFLGHLGGLLAGLLYLYLKRASSRYYSAATQPLIKIISGLLGCWPFRFAQRMFRPSRSRVFGRGTVGGNESGVWRCRACTYDNMGFLNVCEVCGTGRNDDIGLSASSDSTDNDDGDDDETISLEELRQRRVRRFGQL